ncbi:Deleted in malignant brain tumors 1 protein [Holothuria leucospilota]|uniref:Deleted in malignant brain tumors 1 protein n=1 Tax=Holothuria leucospilota TaxID=206669 RepID=A0A9Q1BIY7_HOLLE|nr:Deleted in malignant brain tumors 1 protein [Holothuria leucospilota]
MADLLRFMFGCVYLGFFVINSRGEPSVRCSDPVVNSSVINVVDLSDSETQRFHLTCPPGYTSTGGSIIVCVQDGASKETTWQPDPSRFTCHAPCSLENLADGVKSSHEGPMVEHRQRVKFSCEKGLLFGPSQALCNNGTWLPPLAQYCDVKHGKVSVKHDGRVLVRYDGAEGSICSTKEWDIHNANVVCRQLGRSPYALSATSVPHSNEGGELVHFESVRCNGYETQLIDCGLFFSSCKTKAYAGVVCLDGDESASEGSLRLVNQKNRSDPARGRVEIYLKKKWGSICRNDWSVGDGDVACRQLGYEKAVNVEGDYGSLLGGPIHLDHVRCEGNEKELMDCKRGSVSDNCEFNFDASVDCKLPEKFSLRLINGTNYRVGRVEIFDGAHWRTMSDTFENSVTPELLCDKLGGKGSYSSHNTDGDFGYGLVAPKYSFDCNGEEGDITECEVMDMEGQVDNEDPVNLYCDKEEVVTMNPQLIMLVSFSCAVVIVACAYVIRTRHHRKRVFRRKSYISDRYDNIATIDGRDEEKVPMDTKEEFRGQLGSDSVFKE